MAARRYTNVQVPMTLSATHEVEEMQWMVIAFPCVFADALPVEVVTDEPERSVIPVPGVICSVWDAST